MQTSALSSWLAAVLDRAIPITMCRAIVASCESLTCDKIHVRRRVLLFQQPSHEEETHSVLQAEESRTQAEGEFHAPRVHLLGLFHSLDTRARTLLHTKD